MTVTSGERASGWTNPPASLRVQPFWFWNGEMAETEIEHQLKEMADKGVGGFFLCARQGLTIPYLSAAWFERVRFTVDRAAELGLEVWLYDEYPYPSGIAGGEVLLEHPDAVHRTLELVQEPWAGPGVYERELPWSRELSAVAVRQAADGSLDWSEKLDLSPLVGNHQPEHVFQEVGLTSYNQKRYFTYNPGKRLQWRAPEGNWTIMLVLERAIEDFKYYGTFVDPLHDEAMDTFLRVTHERYAQELGERLGTTVKGMFTDEIGLLGGVPWSPQLLSAVEREYGISLREKLPELLFGGSPETPRLRYMYFQTIHRLLQERFHKKVHDWCERYGMQYIAEVPSVRMTTQRYSHIPGGDTGHEKLGRSLEWILNKYTGGFRYNPKMTSSLARQLDRPRALIECFHSVGWSMTLQDAKWMLDRLAALGITMFNFHAFYYTVNGLTKYDAPPSQFLQNPYWEHFRQLGDYAGRLAHWLGQGKADIAVAVLDPTTSIWTHLGNPFHEFHYGGKNEEERGRLKQLRDDWVELCKSLLLNGIDYDHLDPELLAEADVSGGTIRLGQAEYRVLLLPSMTNLEPAAWKAIRQFAAGGGMVVATGQLPIEELDEGEPICAEIREAFRSDSAGCCLWEQAELLPKLKELQRNVSDAPLVQLDDSALGSVLLQQRTLDDGGKLVFLSNQEGRAVRFHCILPESLQGWQLDRIDLTEGVEERIEGQGEPEKVGMTLGPYESQLLVLRTKAAAATGREAAPVSASVSETAAASAAPAPSSAPISSHSPVRPPAQPSYRTLPPLSEWTIAASPHNGLRLAQWELTLDGSGLQPLQVEPMPLSNVLAKLQEPAALPLRYKQIFGTPVQVQIGYPLRCHYRAQFRVEELPEACFLFMEQGALSGAYTVKVNGRQLQTERWEHVRRYDPHNRQIDIRSLIWAGDNTIDIELLAEQPWDGLIQPLHVTGDFGVYSDPEHERFAIGRKPQAAVRTPWGFEGYPFYAGVLSLTTTMALASGAETPSGATIWRLPPELTPFYDIAELLVDGESLGVCSWTPYEWKLPPESAQSHQHSLELRLTNTLIGMLEGQYFDYEAHATKRIAP
ncbi:hypothetical protein ACFFK0_03600 [Paenibacillus chartarius]|uniref:Glycoside hydrolase n=1 Tax=Paenibacillus chartarius TaxID=747481 RepID=A0ABV6DFW7_9BACL